MLVGVFRMIATLILFKLVNDQFVNLSLMVSLQVCFPDVETLTLAPLASMKYE